MERTLSTNIELPQVFEALIPFAGTWGQLRSQRERYLLRQQSTMSELRAFYDAAAPRLEEIFTHLDKFPMDDLPPAEDLLFQLTLGLTEAALAVEIFDQPGVPFAPANHIVDIDWTMRQTAGE